MNTYPESIKQIIAVLLEEGQKLISILLDILGESISVGAPAATAATTNPTAAPIAAVRSPGARRYHYIDQQGHMITSLPEVEYDGLFHEGLASFQDPDTGNYGFKDLTGNIAIPCRFLDADHFVGSLALVTFKDRSLGFIGHDGECRFHIKDDMDFMGFYDDWIFDAGEAGDLHFYDRQGNIKTLEVLDCEDYGELSEGILPVQIVGEEGTSVWKMFDVRNERLGDAAFHEIKAFHEGLAAVMNEDERWGFADRNGNVVINYRFEYASCFSEGLAIVKENGKYGFIDTCGRQVIPFRYDDAHRFSHGLAAVSDGEKWGYIDRQGKTVIPCIYDTVEDFELQRIGEKRY